MLNINKNFGFSKATGEWILCLDADERVSKELGHEIEQILENSKHDNNGYWIPRKNIIFGKWIEHTGWYPDYQLRLFRKGKGKFPEQHVHEMIKVEGKTEYLKNNLIHFNYDSVDQFLEKMIRIYTTNEAEQLLNNGYTFAWQDAIRFPIKEFLSRFFAREGYKDGFHGLVLSFFMAFYQFVVFAKIWEKQGFYETNDNILKHTEEELALVGKQIRFWFANELIKDATGVIKKNVLKIKRKINS